MKVFEIEDGEVRRGAEVTILEAGGIKLPVIIVGEPGRGREEGILRVELLPGNLERWQSGKYHTTVSFGRIGTTKNGAPMLIEEEEDTNSDQCLVVFRTSIGFRGSNSHQGDRIGWICTWCDAQGEELEPPKLCPKCGYLSYTKPRFAPFPGEVIVKGRIAEGAAGRMGSGEQIIAVLKKRDIFSTGYTGRTYDRLKRHYYQYNGETILSVTWQERIISDIF